MVSKAEKRARAQAKLEAAKGASANPQAGETTPPVTIQAGEKQAAAPKVRTAVVGILQVKTEGVNLRGARQAWYDVLKAHNGKPAQGYLDATAENHPSLPKSGRPENPSGWLRWFVRNGIATIVPPTKTNA